MGAACSTLTRLAGCIVVIAAGAPWGAAAQPRSETLDYQFPAGWTRNASAPAGGISLSPRQVAAGGICVLTVYPAQLSNATAESFHEQIVRNAASQGRMLESPTNEAVGGFLVTTMRQLVPSGIQVWVRIYTVRWSDRGQMIMLWANKPELIHNYSTVVDAMVRAVSLPQVARAPDPSATQSGSSAGLIPGIYSYTTMRYDALSASSVLDQYWYLFSPRGQVCRGYTLPRLPAGSNGDLHRFDFAATANSDPENCGTFEVHGNEVAMRIGRKYAESIVFRVPDSDGKVTIQRATYSLSRRW